MPSTLLHPFPASRLLLVVITLSLELGAQSDVAETPVDPVPSESHRLFIGTDLTVKWQDDYLTVARFNGDRVLVRDAENHPVVVPDAASFRWERRPKVSRAPITITGLDHTRLYSIGRDPATHWNSVQSLMESQQSTQQDIAAAEYSAVFGGQGPNQATMKQLYHIRPGARSALFVPDHGQYSEDLRWGRIKIEQVETAAHDVMSQTYEQGMNLPGSEVFRDKIDEETAAGSYDSFELRFDIASREPIADAYAVIRAKVITPDNPEGGMAVFHQRVGKLDATPRSFNVRKAGLTPGFELQDVQVQIYVQGSELGSNLSERSRPISAKEARGFLLLAHLADHPGETIAPQPVWDLAPAELWAATEPQPFDFPVFISLDEHGQVIGVYRSEAESRDSLAAIDVTELRTKVTGATLRGPTDFAPAKSSAELDQTGRLPPPIVALVGRMIFMPALEQGVPVASVTAVNLADFFR